MGLMMFDVSTPVTCAESLAVPARPSLGDRILTLSSAGDSDVTAETLALTKTVLSKKKGAMVVLVVLVVQGFPNLQSNYW